jgi:D-alanyl-lipoteichoic acid acyltransferase DltB (MBOAT superfamily)
VLFTFQIYGDFSGYSDIAIGTAKLFGIKLMRNFNVPYFSRDIAEFWRRWHISLTTWFRDYVYIPLGGSRPVVPEWVLKNNTEPNIQQHQQLNSKTFRANQLPGAAGEIMLDDEIILRRCDRYKKAIAVRNTFIIFLLSGFWHGANWTFVLWGAYHALLFVPLLLMGKNRRYREDDQTWRDIPRMLLTFVLVVIGWILFRSPDMGSCVDYLAGIGHSSILSLPFVENALHLAVTGIAILVMLGMEWRKQLPNRWWMYYALTLAIWWFAGQDMDFIYFQF